MLLLFNKHKKTQRKHTHARTHHHTHARTRTRTNARAHTHKHTHTRAHTHQHTHTHTHTRTHAHTHRHTHSNCRYKTAWNFFNLFNINKLTFRFSLTKYYFKSAKLSHLALLRFLWKKKLIFSVEAYIK
jgi:hypothetical protein